MKETRNQLRIDEKRVFNGETGARFSTKKKSERARISLTRRRVYLFLSSVSPPSKNRAETFCREATILSLSLFLFIITRVFLFHLELGDYVAENWKRSARV